MRINKSLITYQPTSGAGSGTVTSVALSAPTGFTVSGSPITSSGTLALAFTTGYGIPPLMTGNAGRFLTTNGTTMSWVNIAGTDVTGAALTEVDDTNVTMTLGGTPSTALLRSVSMTLGWAGQLAVSRGGTGAATLTGVLIGNGTSAFTAITGGPNQILRVNGTATGYEFYTASFLTNPMTLNYDMIYQSGGVPTRLPGPTSTTKQFLTAVGDGTNTTSLAWGTIAATDITAAALTKTDDTNVTLTLGGTPATSLIRAVSLTLGWSGQLSVARGGTGASTLNGVLIGNMTAPVTAITGIGGQILRANPSTGVYEFWTPTYLESPFTQLGQIIYSGAGGQPLALNANSTANNMYLRSVSAGTPSWASIQGGDIVGAAITTANDTNIQITASGNTGSALLRTLTLTAGWTGSLSVARGGTGASTLTGVLIGNGTSAVTGVTGTASQLLRRNAGNTAYEFFTHNFISNPMTTLGDIIYGNAAGAPLRLGANATSVNKYLRSVSGGTPTWEEITGFLSGSGTTNFVPIWASSTALGNSPLSFLGGEANFGSNKLVAGNVSAPNGSIMLQDNYSTGHLGNIGTMFSGGNLMLGYCVTPSTSSATAFLSATGLTGFPRSSMVLGEDVSIYTGAAQTVAVGSSVTMSERFRMENNGRLRLNAYTSSLSFTGIAAGYLAFTSGGYIITTATPGGVSGTQDYLAKFDSTGIAVGNSRIVDNGTNFLLNGASSYITGLNLIGDIGIQSASGQASAIVQRSNNTPTSGTSIAFLDAYAITTGTTYTMGGAIEFRASQNWNSTSAGTNIFVQTAPDNTIAPADMFVFLNNGAVRFIGRTSNPLSPSAGTMYYNSSANEMRYYNGTTWIAF